MDVEPPTNLIALRDGKQQAEALISARYAEGLIDADELERRLERLQEVSTIPALERLIVDLVDPGMEPSVALALRAPTGAPTALVRLDEIEAEREITALFASFEQAGRWVPARRTKLLDVFADATLDLREAVLGPGATIIELRCVFSSLSIIVPPKLAVRVEAALMFASLERDDVIPESSSSAADPIVVLTGRVLFANVELCERMIGERGKDARRRRKSEREAKRKAAKQRALSGQQRALPKS